jgi:dipeptidase E
MSRAGARPGRQIIALGGGGFSADPEAPAGRRLDQLILDATGRSRPKICFIGTASGDADSYVVNFHRAFAGRAETHDLNLFFHPRHPHLREFLLGMDAVYVGGGSTLNMLAVWRAHGLDAILADAWRAGVVMAGMSAGMICWFESPVTDSFHDGTLRAVSGLGLLPGSACAHFDLPMRRAAYPALVRDGLAAGHAAEDDVALVFHGTELAEAVSSSPTARAFMVSADGERELPVRRV